MRRRSSGWPERVLSAWDRHCAFCGYDGQRGSAAVGIEAAHVRWYNIDGPDELDNGLALCALDHKLFDRGDLALTERATRSPSRTPSPPAPAQDGGSTTSRDAKSSHGRGQAFPRPVTSTGTRPRFQECSVGRRAVDLAARSISSRVCASRLRWSTTALPAEVARPEHSLSEEAIAGQRDVGAHCPAPRHSAIGDGSYNRC